MIGDADLGDNAVKVDLSWVIHILRILWMGEECETCKHDDVTPSVHSCLMNAQWRTPTTEIPIESSLGIRMSPTAIDSISGLIALTPTLLGYIPDKSVLLCFIHPETGELEPLVNIGVEDSLCDNDNLQIRCEGECSESTGRNDTRSETTVSTVVSDLIRQVISSPGWGLIAIIIHPGIRERSTVLAEQIECIDNAIVQTLDSCDGRLQDFIVLPRLRRGVQWLSLINGGTGHIPELGFRGHFSECRMGGGGFCQSRELLVAEVRGDLSFSSRDDAVMVEISQNMADREALSDNILLQHILDCAGRFNYGRQVGNHPHLLSTWDVHGDPLSYESEVRSLALAAEAVGSASLRDVFIGLASTGLAQNLKRLWFYLSHSLPPPYRPGAWLQLAFASYVGGDGVLARIGVSLILEHDENYSLAHQLGSLLDLCVSPSELYEISRRCHKQSRARQDLLSYPAHEL